MKNLDELFNSLSIFEGAILTNKQLEFVLSACGCPKNPYFYRHFKEMFICKSDGMNIINGLDREFLDQVWENYCRDNRAAVKKAKQKKQIRKKTDERMKQISFKLYSRNWGPLTLEFVEREY